MCLMQLKYWNIREQVCVSSQDCKNILNEQTTEPDMFILCTICTKTLKTHVFIVVCITRFSIKNSLDGNYKFKIF